jgi:hypothetical protein
MYNPIRFLRWIWGGVLLALALSPVLLSGCGGSVTEGGLVPVRGRITLDGGPWPKPGQITFIPVKSSDGAAGATRSAIASFDTDGRFEVAGGYGGAQGLHPGDYWIAVECLEAEPEMPLPGKKAAEPKNYAPPKARSPETSGLTLKVEADKPVDANFDVKSK